MSEPSVYRVDRAAALLVVGVGFVVAAVAVVLAFVLVPRDGVLGTVGWVAVAVALLALVLAARFALRPPVVARLDETGVRARRLRVRWIEVEDVELGPSTLTLTTESGRHSLDLTPIGSRRVELARDAYDRLNAAHGYTRFG